MANKPYPVRISAITRADIATTALDVRLSQPETVRQAIVYGLPVVRKKFAKKK
jgi:hypothetical protein